MKICLNMIVRNEADKMERCLASVAPYISSYAILDTGSTDGTPEVIQKFFDERGIPGQVGAGTFTNFQQARNDALHLARTSPISSDYLLLCDADMSLVVEDPHAFDALTATCYLMTQRAGGVAYSNARLLKTYTPHNYIGVTHEYLDAPHNASITGAFFDDHADGNNRKDKYIRDINLLTADLQTDPNNGRSWFYLAQSYRELGNTHCALCAYKRRVELGGWDEEIWNSQFNIAHCYKNLGNEGEFVRNLLLAYNLRPSRAETLYDLAHHFREKGWNAPAALFAEVGLKIKKPGDHLFVNEFIYTAGLKEELAITGFYNDRTKQEGFEACDQLSLLAGDYPWQRQTAKRNLYHYLPTLNRLVSSFRPERIDWTPPDGWSALNPSVAVRGAELNCIIRTVNYRITDDGQYAIQGDDGNSNNTNPIRTRNYLAKFSLHSARPHTVREIIYNQNFPVRFPLVVGFEDARLIPCGHYMSLTACVREMESDGMCQQVHAMIGTDHVLKNIMPIARLPRAYEKNWMPILTGAWDVPVQYMYRLNHIVDQYGQDVAKFPNTLDVGQISGGSQVIPFFGGYLAVVHEAMQHDNYANRYYQHRFAYFNSDLSLRSLSLPFVFLDKQIEFCAGLSKCSEFELILSFGVRDREAWIARIEATDVMELEQCRR